MILSAAPTPAAETVRYLQPGESAHRTEDSFPKRCASDTLASRATRPGQETQGGDQDLPGGDRHRHPGTHWGPRTTDERRRSATSRGSTGPLVRCHCRSAFQPSHGTLHDGHTPSARHHRQTGDTYSHDRTTRAGSSTFDSWQTPVRSPRTCSPRLDLRESYNASCVCLDARLPRQVQPSPGERPNSTRRQCRPVRLWGTTGSSANRGMLSHGSNELK
jgi:hypothetical protein